MTAPAPPAHVWVDPRLVVRSSPIEGSGLRAAAPVPAGVVVVRLGGRLVGTGELEALLAASATDPAAPFVDTITVDEGAHLVLPPDTAAHYGNHSCDPTLWHVGPYALATRRALRPGDEATIDYATQSGAALTMVCRCGAASCRGMVTSDDWRRPELRRRYGVHWTPALLDRIASARVDMGEGTGRGLHPPEPR